MGFDSFINDSHQHDFWMFCGEEFLILAGLFGLLFGSFGTVLASRAATEESITTPRSHCRTCDHSLAWFENIPLLSFLALRGRCRKCRQPISPLYPLIEITTALLFLLSYRVAGLTTTGIALAALAVVTPPLFVIDVQQKRLPNSMTGALFFVATGALIAEAILRGGAKVLPAVVAAVALGAAFFLIRILSGGGMGMGDVKLVVGFGVSLGLLSWKTPLTGVILGFVLGAFAAIPSLIRRDLKRALPFGPFLLIGAWIAVAGGTTLAGTVLGLWGIK